MAVDFAAARSALAVLSLEHQRRWVELVDLLDSIEQAAKAKRSVRAKIKRALDLEYDLTGHCVCVEPLANALGLPEEL